MKKLVCTLLALSVSSTSVWARPPSRSNPKQIPDACRGQVVDNMTVEAAKCTDEQIAQTQAEIGLLRQDLEKAKAKLQKLKTTLDESGLSYVDKVDRFHTLVLGSYAVMALSTVGVIGSLYYAGGAASIAAADNEMRASSGYPRYQPEPGEWSPGKILTRATAPFAITTILGFIAMSESMEASNELSLKYPDIANLEKAISFLQEQLSLRENVMSSIIQLKQIRSASQDRN